MLVARPRSRAARLLVACALALALWSLLAWAAARSLVVRADIAHADALVVLAGSSVFEERARLAAGLYAEGRAPVVLLTNDNERGGWSSAEQRNPFFVERAVAELTRAGVPRERITVLPTPVASTYDEACELRDYATLHQTRSLLVVTSAYHTRRALWVLRRVIGGVEIGIVPVEPGGQTPAPARWWLEARGWRVVAGEYAKLVYYHFYY
ncbi:MAG: YdcF family protein [Pyrinomonadaceae bacterium]